MNDQPTQPVNQKLTSSVIMWVVLIIILIIAVVGAYLWWQNGETNTNTVVNTVNTATNENENSVSNTTGNTNLNLQVTNSTTRSGWRSYNDDELSFSIEFPNSYSLTPDPIKPDKLILTSDENNSPVVIWVVENTSGELSDERYETKSSGTISLGGESGIKFIYQICDGPSCTPTIVAYDVIHNSKEYVIEFYGDNVIDDTEQMIIDLFKFI